MDVKLHGNDRIRMTTDRGRLFCDLQASEGQRFLAVDLYPGITENLTLLKKNGILRMVVTKPENQVANEDLGWWADAEVVWQSQKPQE